MAPLALVHLLRDLRAREPDQVRERDHLAVLLGQLFERALDALDFLASHGRAARRGEAPIAVEQRAFVEAAAAACRRTERDLALCVALLREIEVASVEDLPQRGGVQPLLEGRLARKLKAIDVLDHLAAHRLHDVGARLASSDHRNRAQPHEGVQLRQVADDQRVDGRPISLRGALCEAPEVLRGAIHGMRASIPASADPLRSRALLSLSR